eukprot:scaffold71281_cov66-Phaeocystis_antarctica.AAC.2
MDAPRGLGHGELSSQSAGRRGAAWTSARSVGPRPGPPGISRATTFVLSARARAQPELLNSQLSGAHNTI